MGDFLYSLAFCVILSQNCLGNVFQSHANAQLQFSTNVNSDEPSLTANADEAKTLVDNFLKKLKDGKGSTKQAADTCGYDSCYLGEPGMLNVHLVPHTHDDVGWLQTVDEYFYGSGTAGVQYILDTVIQELNDDPRKRFIYVEVAFFTRWWNELHDMSRHIVRELVWAGRLEFILGGWCMNDEAATHYSSIIDQHTHGFRFLYYNFGECGRPKIGWQIDPFGHSREQASIFAQFGFDGLFFSRLDYQDLNQRLKTKTLEHMWMGSESLGDQSTLFTGILYGGYGPPGGFCFECGDQPMMDDPRLENYNVDQRVNEFLNAVNDQAQHYISNHIMLTMGSDFQYENARHNFKNMDKLIYHVNMRQLNGSRVNAFYSTPSCYVYAMNKLNLTYTAKMDDFFPYADGAHNLLTGFFTSRPALKGYERSSNNFLQVCKQLEVLSLLGPEHGSTLKVDILKDALGVLQHHDAVSGTERQHVAFDYAKMASEGMSACQEVVNDAFSMLLPLSKTMAAPMVQFCQLANVSNCPVSESNKQFVVLIYNPIGRPGTHHVRIPVSGNSYTVKDAQLQSVVAQVVQLSSATMNLPDHKGSMATGDLVFESSLPALGFSSYFVQSTTFTESPAIRNSLSLVSRLYADDITIKNQYISLTFSGTNGLLKGLSNLEKSLSISLSNSLQYYKSFDDGPGPASTAYVFRPNGTDSIPVSDSVTITTLVQGAVVQEVHQMFGSWASQVVRLYNDARYVEIEWTIGPIPIDDKIGKEVISRFESDLSTNKTFFTDSNGREILTRVRDYRPTWQLDQTEPIAGNYYPVNSRIFIQDVAKNLQLTVLTDRSQGGASIRDGELELMMHRRLVHIDFSQWNEGLNEPGLDGKGLTIRGKYYLFLDTIEGSVRLHRDAAQKIYMSPALGFIPISTTPDAYSQNYHTKWSGLKNMLPENVHLLTLESWHSGMILLRLEHFYQKNEDKNLSQNALVHLKDLFAPFMIASVEEQTLGANQPLEGATRLQWNVQGYGRTQRDLHSYVIPIDPNLLVVELKPMQIRTFHVTIE